jgi:hypothetical protein
VDDIEALTELNAQFVDAFRGGSWKRLEPILSANFSYLDGATGEVWPIERYIADLDGMPEPSIGFDELRIHVAGDVAVVSARTFTRPGRFNRYVDTYERRAAGWVCVHACVWPICAG